MTVVQHERYMRRAIELARNVLDLPFGALIVDSQSGEIMAEGWNRTATNPLWHGEIDAMNQLAKICSVIQGEKLILYTTAESCPMCQGAIIWYGIGTVVYGSSIRYLQSQGWWQIGILSEEVVRQAPFRQCTIIGGIMEPECDALFASASRQGPFRTN